MTSFRLASRVFCAIFCGALGLLLSGAKADSTPTAPLPAGLVLWLDASDSVSVKTDADGKVVKWRDKSGQSHDVADGEDRSTRPQLVPNALNNQSAVRFSGHQLLRLPTPIRTSLGEVTVIVVSRRSPNQAGGEKQQRLIASQPSIGKSDQQSSVPIGPLTIGGTKDGQ